jgi:hypothetical protein
MRRNQRIYTIVVVVAVVLIIWFLYSGGMNGGMRLPQLGGGSSGDLSLRSITNVSYIAIGFWILVGIGLAYGFMRLRRSR